ncbi:carbon-nitrogen family hydrolase [Candidatus Margulisiibacteriota bacterium]
MKEFTIAAIQMDVKLGDIEFNLRTAQTLIDKAAKAKPQLITLPEMFATGFDYPCIKKMASETYNELIAFLINNSHKYNCYIVGGTIPEMAEDKLYNTSFVSSPDRKIIGAQRKIHPFTLTEEHKYFAGGESLNVINCPLAKLGIVICYDIRFPEVARALTLKGAEVLICPAQFPAPRAHHWEILIKSRAIENQVYAIGNNRVGGRKTKFFGKSMVASPHGEAVKELGDQEGVLIASIDLEKIKKEREQIPALLERKPEIYQ